MSTANRPVVYRSLTERVTTMLWGTAVVAFGIGVFAWLAGYDFDLEMAGIVTCAVLGVWILGASILAMAKRDDD